MRAMTGLRIVVAASVALVAACSSAETTTGSATSVSETPSQGVDIVGDASTDVNKIAIAAIADLQTYWTEEYPQIYPGAYEPVAGGFYAVVPSSGDLPPCASSPDDIAGNAFYCSTADNVAWDSEGLFPELQSKFGDDVIPLVLAHEWGHAVQARSEFEGMTVTREIQADCFAGAFAQRMHTGKTSFQLDDADLDLALAGFLSLRDTPGSSSEDPSAHGSGFDRVTSFQTGYGGGAESCTSYADGTPPVLELPFTTQEDADRAGNAPLEQIYEGVPKDLEDYWTALWPELHDGEPWTPLKNGVIGFDPDDAPTCGGSSTSDYLLFYCVPDDYVGFDATGAMPQFYDQGGDFAVASLIATQYGLAAEAREGDTGDEKSQSLKADCLAGGWTASVLLQNRPTSGYSLSPGDLDEALSALLLFRGSGDVDRQGSGFERVQAFQSGVIDGAQAC
ncbi:neutral zinc metallopeptidase [Actinomycetes bacterium M1A6_2h]